MKMKQKNGYTEKTVQAENIASNGFSQALATANKWMPHPSIIGDPTTLCEENTTATPQPKSK